MRAGRGRFRSASARLEIGVGEKTMADASRMFALTGQVAVVTGAGRGIGRGIATALAEAGADIVAVGRHPADAVADHVGSVGRRCHSLVLDLSDPAQAEEVIP